MIFQVYLNPDQDAELIDLLLKAPKGTKSQLLRNFIREGFKQSQEPDYILKLMESIKRIEKKIDNGVYSSKPISTESKTLAFGSFIDEI